MPPGRVVLHRKTVSNDLQNLLQAIMDHPDWEAFRLVGGTALSLQLGHRMSVDLDLFSDAPYGTLAFSHLDRFVESYHPESDVRAYSDPGMGKTYWVGPTQSAIKVDVYYTDPFLDPPLIAEGIRMASLREIAAMKMDVVLRGGRKKDFWDLHALRDRFRLEELLEAHSLRYPYHHDRPKILHKLTSFGLANDDFEPICLLGKYWELIREDWVDWVNEYRREH
jgi:hypothetical protein